MLYQVLNDYTRFCKYQRLCQSISSNADNWRFAQRMDLLQFWWREANRQSMIYLEIIFELALF